jgi:hypothetical protein
MKDRARKRTRLFRAGVIVCLATLSTILLAAVPAPAQEATGSALSKSIPERDATAERQALAFQQEAAQNSYLAMRPYLSRYLGFAIFLGFCLVLIYFLQKRIEQREYLRRVGFIDTPEIEPEEE